MKWILAILCGIALQVGAIMNGVFATKSPYVVEAATMDFDIWTNSVLWLTAESPVLNSGTTNANWICYAKNCSGNATQTNTGLQPQRIFTNGQWAINGDGIDDYLSIPNTSSVSKSIFFEIWLPVAGTSEATNYINRSICSGSFDSIGFGGGGDPYNYLEWRGGGTNYTTQYYVSILPHFTGGWKKVCMVRDASANRFVFTVNGTNYISAAPNPPITEQTSITRILGHGSGLQTRYLTAPIRNFTVFNYAIPTNIAVEITR